MTKPLSPEQAANVRHVLADQPIVEDGDPDPEVQPDARAMTRAERRRQAREAAKHKHRPKVIGYGNRAQRRGRRDW